MDKNRVESIKKEIKGSAKELGGKVTGNPTKESAGHSEKKLVKSQKDVGKIRDDEKKRNR
jgi:uncharacterized protein YjbJ (UPF0337 family)